MPSTNLETWVMSPAWCCSPPVFHFDMWWKFKKKSEKNGKTRLYFTSMTLTVRTHSPDWGGLGLTNAPWWWHSWWNLYSVVSSHPPDGSLCWHKHDCCTLPSNPSFGQHLFRVSIWLNSDFFLKRKGRRTSDAQLILKTEDKTLVQTEVLVFVVVSVY